MFLFYQYIKPDEYRFAPSEAVHPAMHLPDFRTVEKAVLGELHWQDTYHTEEAMLADAGFQLWKRGYCFTEGTKPLSTQLQVTDLEDNYRFVRTWFGQKWAAYILWLRVQEGQLWRTEWKAFRATAEADSASLLPLPMFHLAEFSAEWKPTVSVIIATRNRPAYLKKMLEDLKAQVFPPTEVVVVDQSTPEAQDIEVTKHLVQPNQVGQWTARNAGVAEATGEYLAFLDDDVRVEPTWLQDHLRILRGWSVQVSTGVFLPSSVPVASKSAYYASQWNANNSVMHRSVWEGVGPFDVAYDGTRWGDHEFGLRAYRAGFSLVQNPLAYALDQSAAQGGLREGPEPSFAAYRTKGGGVAQGVAHYFATYFSEEAYMRWKDTRIPWRGNGGLSLWGRLVWYWLKRSFQKRIKR